MATARPTELELLEIDREAMAGLQELKAELYGCLEQDDLQRCKVRRQDRDCCDAVKLMRIVIDRDPDLAARVMARAMQLAAVDEGRPLKNFAKRGER